MVIRTKTNSDTVSDPVFPGRGIVAGCAFATTELQALLFISTSCHLTAFQMEVFVDDLASSFAATTNARHGQRWSSPSPSSTRCWWRIFSCRCGTRPRGAHLVQVAAPQSQNTGWDAMHGSATARGKEGVTPLVMFGVGVTGISPAHPKQVRSQAVWAFGCGARGARSTFGMVLHGRHDPAVEAITGSLCHNVAGNGRQRPSSPAKRARTSLLAWSLFCAPLQQVCPLHRIEWKFINLTSLRTHVGSTISLLLTAPAALKSRVRSAVAFHSRPSTTDHDAPASVTPSQGSGGFRVHRQAQEGVAPQETVDSVRESMSMAVRGWRLVDVSGVRGCGVMTSTAARLRVAGSKLVGSVSPRGGLAGTVLLAVDDSQASSCLRKALSMSTDRARTAPTGSWLGRGGPRYSATTAGAVACVWQCACALAPLRRRCPSSSPSSCSKIACTSSPTVSA